MVESSAPAALSTGAVAAALGISQRAVLRAVRRGALVPALRTPGGHYRFTPAAVAAYAPARHVTWRQKTETDGHMRRIYQALTGGVLILDAEGRIDDANAAAEDLLGVPLSQMRGRVHGEMFLHATCGDGSPLPPGERPAMIALRTGQPVCGLAVRLPHTDGTTRQVQVDAVPVCDEAGAVAHVVVSYVDLTARLEAEEARRASEDRYRRLVETAQEGIWELDTALATTYVNRKMATLLGHAPETCWGVPSGRSWRRRDKRWRGQTWHGSPMDMPSRASTSSRARTGPRSGPC